MKLLIVITLLATPFLTLAQLPLPLKLYKDAIAIKKAKIKTITIQEKNEANEFTLHSVKSFTPEGRIIQETHYVGSPTIDSYQYNASGMLTHLIKTLKDGTILENISFTYQDGYLVEEKHQSKTNAYSVIYKYTPTGLIDTSFISSTESQMKIWHYNKEKKLSALLLFSHSTIDSDKEWIQNSREVFYYNKKKLLYKTASCFCRLCFSNIYHYNKKKQLIGISEYQNEDLLSKSTIEYNKKKLIAQKSFDTYNQETESITRSHFEIFEYTFY
ncbi:hypothetical protein [Aureispira anguillae]|nr:hypothetical protein [Aureispira anguillae]